MSNLSTSLEETLMSESVSKIQDTANPLSADYADITLSAILEDSVLGQIPVIKTLYTVGKIWGGISNYLLVEKVLTFLFQLKGISVNERKKFLDSLDGAERREIINQLMTVLANHDRLIKSAIQGRLFRARASGYICKTNYFSLTHSVNQVDAELFDVLSIFYSADRGMSQVSAEDAYSLASLRLIAIDSSEVGLFGGGGPTYEKNKLGVLLVLIGLQKKLVFTHVESVIGTEEATSLFKILHL